MALHSYLRHKDPISSTHAMDPVCFPNGKAVIQFIKEVLLIQQVLSKNTQVMKGFLECAVNTAQDQSAS